MVLRALIVDDEPRARNTLRHFLCEYCADTLVVVGEAETVVQAGRVLRETRPDVVFLDVELGEYNGLDSLQLLREQYADFFVIIVTGYEQYGVRALNEGAIYYVLKPIDPDVLVCAVEQLQDRYTQKNERRDPLYLRVEAGREHVVSLEALLYCTSEGNYCRLHLEHKESLVTYTTIKHLYSLLPSHFLRIEHSCIVNLRYVGEYLYTKSSASVVLRDGTVLPVSRRQRGELRQRLHQMGRH